MGGVAERLGYRHHPPNAGQRVVRWIAGTRVGAWLLARSLRRVDALVLRVTSGRRTLTSIVAGLPVIVLVTTGARSGRSRRSTVLGVPLDAALAVSGADFGRGRVPAWTANLAAHPRAVAEYGARSVQVIARPASDLERTTVIAMAGEIMPQVATYVVLCAGRELPVFVLEAE
jgi:deazaflavin-dependent oxidoreductase (nitroreductase family)